MPNPDGAKQFVDDETPLEAQSNHDPKREGPPGTVWGTLGLAFTIISGAYCWLFKTWDKSEFPDETFQNPTFWWGLAILLALTALYAIRVKTSELLDKVLIALLCISILAAVGTGFIVLREGLPSKDSYTIAVFGFTGNGDALTNGLARRIRGAIWDQLQSQANQFPRHLLILNRDRDPKGETEREQLEYVRKWARRGKGSHLAIWLHVSMQPAGQYVATATYVNPHNKNEGMWVRGSVWVEQEIAIAAFMSQVLKLPMRVRSYVHDSIRREGLRDKILLNPMSFREDSEILDDLASTLPLWRDLRGRRRKEEFSLIPKISSRRAPVPGEGEDRRYELSVTVMNDGERDVPEVTVNVEFPSMFLDESPPPVVKPSGKTGIIRLEVNSKTQNIGNIYSGLETPSLIQGLFYVIRGKTRKENPELLDQKVTAIVSSGLSKSTKVSKTIAELSPFQ